MAPDTPAPPPSCTPPSCGQLFTGFTRVGLSGFGGVLPWARRMLVEERRWLSGEEFTILLGLCQFLPGPNVVNLAVVVGQRFHGAAGAWAAGGGLLCAPFLIALLLAELYGEFGHLPAVADALRGITAVGAGLLIAMAIKMIGTLRFRRLLLPFTALAFIAVALLRWPMPPVMIGLAVISVALTYQRLGK